MLGLPWRYHYTARISPVSPSIWRGHASSALCGSAPLTALWGAMDDGGPQLQLPLAALMGSGKIIAIARLAFFRSRDYIFLFTERHPGVEKLEVMLVNTDLVSNSQRKTKFIWCARKIRTLLGRFARARKFLDRGTPGLRSKFESQSARMPNIRKASPECSKAQSLLHFKAKFSFQHPISHLFHTSTGPLSPGLRLFLRLLSRSRFRPSRGRAGVSLGLDGWL